MLLNFKKSMGLLTGLVSLTFLFLFFLFYPSILGLLIIEFHNLFRFVFYKVITIFKKSHSIGLTFNFVIVFFYYYYHIVK